MTTPAECAALAPLVSKHAGKASDGTAALLNQASAILAGIGAGVSTAQTSPQIYAAAAAACLTAAARAVHGGNSSEASQLRTAQMILINLSQGV